MSKQSLQTMQQAEGSQPPSLIERLQQAALSARSIAGQVWDEAKPMFDHGRTELAAALFTGHAHVMYMKGQEGLDKGVEPEKDQAQPAPTPAPAPQREPGGREM